MITVSLCMIVKNEEAVLARCLDSVRDLVEEIIIVDTGSDDRTKEIASRYTRQVFDFPWADDFAAARNESFAHATKDYCLWMDADDVLLDADRDAFRTMKEQLDPTTDVVMLPYHIAFDEKGNPSFTYYRERLLRNHAGFRWEGAVHEVIAPAGVIVYGEAAVTHRKTGPGDPDRNLRIYEKLLAEGRPLGPRQQFYYGRELYDHGRYREAEECFLRFLENGNIWVENAVEACRQLAFCRYAQGREREALAALLRSLEYDTPRAELCCDIGKHFFDREMLAPAVFWYTLASTRPRNDRSGGFVLPDCYDYIPYLQLCVCYDRLGDGKTAREYNEKAGHCKPDSPAYLYNRTYFDDRMRQPPPAEE